MKKLLVCVLALGGFAASAQAADLGLDSLKDPLPDAITYKGVTIYGTIDIGYAYQTHGAPLSGALGTGIQDNMFGSISSNKQISTIAPNGLTQSFIGFKVEEQFAPGWTVLAKGETGFQPTSGELADGCASLARVNGVSPFRQESSGDSSRCGQAFNGELYAGVSNSTYGTLRVGRQNSLDLDLLAAYDPLSLSYAFSLLGYSGGAGAGVGDTEAGRWDNSVKYVYQYGPAHASFMYSDGSQDSALQGSGIAGGAGFTWKGLSVDGLYTKENSVVSASAFTGAVPAGFPLDKSLNATISDNTAWTVGAKYTFDVAPLSGFDFGLSGGFKDEPSSAKFTVFGGYQRVDFANPTDIVSPGSTTIGGYFLANTVNNNFFSDRIRQTYWAGAKYEVGPWSFAGAYYGVDQNSFLKGAKGTSCAQGFPATTTPGLNPTPSQCAGNFNMGGFDIDYAFNKHFDIYAGVNYSVVSGGLASGFIQDNSFLFMTGMRLKF